jgi:PAS domain S-box-containing protein
MELCLNIPVIVLTGYADFTFGVKSLSLGISDYLLKDELTSISLYKSIIYSRERKRATSALIESERKYSELFQLSPLPMWVVDTDTLQLLDVNMATIDHYGYSREELLSMTLRDIRPAEDVPALERGIAEDRLHLDEHPRRIVRHKKKSGELRHVEIQIAPILYKGNKANLVISTDITDRLNYINAIEGQNEKLREISWMQSHIIRAPLSRIMALVPLINAAAINSDEQKTMLEYLTLSANELDAVIRNITDKTSEADYKLPDH